MKNARLTQIRGEISQAEFAKALGVHKNTIARYESGVREPDGPYLKALIAQGWNANWVLTGEGPERLEALQDKGSVTAPGESQPPRLEELKVAVQLTEEALDGGYLAPDDYAELVTLIYDALVNGLPSAQVLAFARPAARGIKEKGGSDRSDVGGKGPRAAGKGAR